MGAKQAQGNERGSLEQDAREEEERALSPVGARSSAGTKSAEDVQSTPVVYEHLHSHTPRDPRLPEIGSACPGRPVGAGLQGVSLGHLLESSQCIYENSVTIPFYR